MILGQKPVLMHTCSASRNCWIAVCWLCFFFQYSHDLYSDVDEKMLIQSMNSVQNFVNSYKYNISHSVKNFLLTPSSSKLMNIFSGKESADGHHDKSYRNKKVIRCNLYFYISPFLWRWTTYIWHRNFFVLQNSWSFCSEIGFILRRKSRPVQTFR